MAGMTRRQALAQDRAERGHGLRQMPPWALALRAELDQRDAERRAAIERGETIVEDDLPFE